jgi:hypothetical protein
LVDGGDVLGVVDAAWVSGGDGQVGVPELPLDDEQRDPLARHLDRVRVAELMRREPAPDPGGHGGVVQLGADSGRSEWPPACRAAQEAEQPAGRQFPAEFEPWVEVRPCPAVHPDLAALLALAVADEQRAAAWVEVGLVEGEPLADPQARGATARR